MSFEQRASQHRSWVVTVAVVVPAALCAAIGAAPDVVPDASAAVALVLVIVAAAATGLRRGGLAAAASSAVSFDYFLTRPYRSLAIDSAEDVEVAALLLLVGVAVTELALWGQRQRADSGRQRGYLEGVMAAAESVSRNADLDTVTTSVAARIRVVLDLDRCEFVPGHVLAGGPVLQRDGSVTQGSLVLDVDRTGLPVDRSVVLPVHGGGVGSGRLPRGFFELTSASHVTRPTADQRRVAALLADQVAAVPQG